jgi:hypothetical protein
MADLVVSVIPSSAQRVAAMLGGMGSYLDRFTRDMLLSEAAAAANAFIRFTPPIPKGGGDGRSPAAKKQGEIAVERDIRSWLMPDDKSLTSAVQSAVTPYESFLKWKAGPTPRWGRVATWIHGDDDIARAWQKAQNIAGKSTKFGRGGYPLQDATEIKQVHETYRQRYRGRITRNGGPPMLVAQKPFSADPKLINDYIKQRQLAVGTLSNYWWTIILKIPPILIRGAERRAGQTGVPAWVKRHRKGQGLFIDQIGTKASITSSVTIVAPIGDIFGVAKDAKTKQNVIKFRKVANQLKPWQRILDQALLVTNRGGKPT